MNPAKLWNIAIIVGLVVALIGLGALLVGLDNERSVSDLRTIEADHAYSFAMQVSSGRAVHVQYSISNNTAMTILVTSFEGHEQIIQNGAPSPENEFYRLEDASNGSFTWTPSTNGVFYLTFYNFHNNVIHWPPGIQIESGAQLKASATYFGSLPELILVGTIATIIGIAVTIASVFMKSRSLIQEKVRSQETTLVSQNLPETEEKIPKN